MAISPAVPALSTSSLTLGSGGVTITHKTDSWIGIPRYTVTWSFAGQSGTLATKTENQTTTWTPALATFAGYIPDATNGTATITVTTYDFSESQTTAVGSKSVTMTLIVPESAKPTTSSVSVAAENSALPSSGFSGIYVKGYSKFKLTVSASGTYGSKIKRITFTAEGKTYTGTYNATSVSSVTLTSNAITQAGSGKSVSYVVTDSRGRTVSGTIGSLTVQDYTAPKITSLKARRSNGSTASTTGTNAQRYITATVTAVGSNAITSATLYWKTKSGTYSSTDSVSIATSGTAIPSSGSAAWTVIAKSGTNVTFNGVSSYDFKLEVTDKIGNTTTAYTTISTTSVVLDFKNDGTGLGIGKISEAANTVESAWTFSGTYFKSANYYRTYSNGQAWIVNARALDDTTNRLAIAISANNQFYINEYTSTGIRESYDLPTPTATADTSYSFLTSKSAVTVAQGGTGATGAWQALTNLGGVHISGDTLSGGETWTQLGFKSTNSAYTATGAIYGSHNANYTRIGFTEWYKDSTYSEDYLLPTPTTHSDERKWYSILTSKNAVTVGQGGTGATTAAQAAANLSVLPLSGGTLSNSLFIENGGYLREKTDTSPFWALQVYSAGNLSRAVAAVSASNNWYFPEFQTAGSGREDYSLPAPTNTTSTTKSYNILTTKFFQFGSVASTSVSASSYKTGTVNFTTPYTGSSLAVVLSLEGGAANQKKFGNVSVRVTGYVASGTASGTAGFAYEIDNADSSSVNVGFSWMAYGNS